MKTSLKKYVSSWIKPKKMIEKSASILKIRQGALPYFADSIKKTSGYLRVPGNACVKLNRGIECSEKNLYTFEGNKINKDFKKDIL